MHHPPDRVESISDFLQLFDEEVHGQLLDRWNHPGTDGLIKFTNLDMGSSQIGKSACMPVGEPWTIKTVAGSEDQHLGDVPSRFQYPTEYVLKEGVAYGGGSVEKANAD